MCGIFFSASSETSIEPDEDLVHLLEARGPDSLQKHVVNLKTGKPTEATVDSGGYLQTLTFVATVLALRGDRVESQPLVDQRTQSVLCWNGEAWKVNDQPVPGNDSSLVFRLLLRAAGSPPTQVSQNILAVLTSIAGPFSFVFYDALSSHLYYGRDWLGRRSLLYTQYAQGTLILSSVSGNGWPSNHEVETHGIYCLSLRANSALKAEMLPWARKMPQINRNLPVFPITALSVASSSLINLERQLREALRLRVTGIPDKFSNDREPHKAKIAVLFSGGLDCTLLARLAHEIVAPTDSIDLLNVAFENPRSIAANAAQATSPYESCPDRLTARSGLHQLNNACPGRRWRFVAIDVPFAEVLVHRPFIIGLMRPHNTEMDLSVAMALYFAARGRGCIKHESNPTIATAARETQAYTTTARVLLSGLGADELFAGYTRHAAAFSRRGYMGLIDELELELRRIGQRNLGRDDRVMSAWAREVRYPYLDEGFVDYALTLSVWEKCGFREGRQKSPEQDLDPAKQILRLLALKLGMDNVAKEKKRAIQFGARTAKMEIGRGKRKGTDILY